LRPSTRNSGSADTKELERSLISLLRLSDRLNSIFDLDTLLDVLVQQALDLTNAQSGCAGLRTSNGMSCGHFLHGSDVVPFLYDSGPGTGWAGWVVTNKTPYFTTDALKDTIIVPDVRERFGVVSGMCIPIIDGEKEVIGFFEVYKEKSSKKFNQQDLKNCVAAAQIAALAIQNVLTNAKLVALAAFSRSLTLAGDLEQIVEVTGHHLETNFHCGFVLLLPADQGLVVRFRTLEFLWTDKELEAASWCWQHGREAGAQTAILPGARARYLPLMAREQTIGVLGLESRADGWLSAPQRELLAGFVGQSSLAIERGLLEQKVRRLRFLDESERLQNAILVAISHEVRAPIAAITAAVSALLSPGLSLDRPRERKLLGTAEYEIKRLHRLMNNLLSVTRIQAGVSRLKLEPSDLSDIVGAALEELGTLTRKRRITVQIPSDLPLVPMDFDLITQVLVNLFSNAIKFSPSDQPIDVRGQIVDGKLEVSVVDRGRGIPSSDLDRVFQKFHRLEKFSSVDGLGLGLFICKEFVEAHRGQIRLEINPEGGTIATMVLPCQTSPAVRASESIDDKSES
jgi:two-component system, OmpR family, sensor histidine kinase KdpD